MARRDDEVNDDDRPRKPRRRDDEDDERPRKARRRDEDDDEPAERPRKARRRDEDDDDLDATSRKSQGKSKLPLILGIVAGVLLLVCGGGAFGIYFIVSKARDKVGEAGDRMTSSNNLKQIGLGMLNYSDVNKATPTNSYDPAGKPLLSWRVHILPYVEEQALYSQFKLNEPWDSPGNRPLLSRMPKVYATPAERVGRSPIGTKTYYRGFSMPGAMMEAKSGNQPPGKFEFVNPLTPRGPKNSDVTDGLSNTLLAVEAGEAVDWTKPDDISWAPGQPLPSLGGDRKTSDVFLALFGDGSVKPLKKTITPEQFKAAITYAGKEVVILD